LAEDRFALARRAPPASESAGGSVRRDSAAKGSLPASRGLARRGYPRQTAAADLRCEHVEIVLVFDRRYANTASVRYVIEGCGQRATYAESCQTYPQCRYLLLSVVSIPGAATQPRRPR
jgi:hypothetical protein